MTSTVLWNIEHAKRLLATVEEDLKNAPEKADIAELMEACERIDQYYKNRFCAEMDAEYDEKNDALLSSISIENIIICEEIINSSIQYRLDYLHFLRHGGQFHLFSSLLRLTL